MTEHDPRRFVDSLDFRTSPGFLDGAGSREAAGLPPDTGPFRVITNLCVMGYSEAEKMMEVISLHPGVSMDDVQEKTGFKIEMAGDGETAPPTDEELRILRKDVDPAGVLIGRG